MRGSFAILLLSFLALRFATLLTSVEYVSLDEELYLGIIGKELIDGLKTTLWDYHADHSHGGSLVVGLLTIPPFLLLGPNLFALKLVPLLFSLATLAISFIFLKRFFDKKTALYAGALFVLSPPVFTSLSLTAYGSHPESIFFSSVMLFCFYSFLYKENGRTLSLALLGLVAGLGGWFTPITFVTLLTCLVSWFLLDRRSFLSRKMFVFLGFMAVGLLPWVLYNATHEYRALRFLIHSFQWGSLSPLVKIKDTLEKIAILLLKTIPSSFYLQTSFGIPGWVLSLSYYLAGLLVVVPFFWQESRKLIPILRESLRRGRVLQDKLAKAKLVPFLLYPFFFLLIYGGSNFPPLLPMPCTFERFKYLPPLYFFGFLLLAAAIRQAKRPALFLGIFLMLGLIGQGSLLCREPLGRAFLYRGYSYVSLGEVWGTVPYPFPQKLGQFQNLADRFGGPERRSLYWGLSRVIQLAEEEDWDKVIESTLELPSPYRFYLLEGCGRALSPWAEENFSRLVKAAGLTPEKERAYFYRGLTTGYELNSPHFGFWASNPSWEAKVAFIKRWDPRYRESFYLALGRHLYYLLEQMGWDEGAIKLLDSLGKEEKAWVCRGMGEWAGICWANSGNFIKTFDSLLAILSMENRESLFLGIGWGVGEVYLVDRIRVLDHIRRLQGKAQGWAFNGYRAFETWYGI